MRRQYRRRRRRINLSFLGGGLLVLGLTLAGFGMQRIHAQPERAGILEGALGGRTSEQCEAVMDACDARRYVGDILAVPVEKPLRRTLEEAMDRLRELGKIDPVIANICENSALYPENMLTALANNPEMADFVAGYPGGASEDTIRAEPCARDENFPLFLQWDPRWGYEPYGKTSNIGLAGCGPTCMAMVLYYLTGDETLTPDRIAAYALENGYFVEGTGTAWSLMEDIPLMYGVGVAEAGASEAAMKAELDRGHVLICAMGPGDFTAAGHFIVIYGYDEDGFMVNDPNCVARSSRSWRFDELSGQMKKLWSYGGTEKRSKECYFTW